MLDAAIVAAIVFAASIIGALARAILPYLRARAAAEQSGEPTPPFQQRYTFTAILAIVVSSIVGILLFPSIIENAPTAVLTGVFVYGFIAGWGSTSIFNEVMATALPEKPKPIPAPTP